MKDCPSCGAAVPDSASHCPSCQHGFPGGSSSKQTLMGVPSEGGEDSEVDDNDEPRSTESTEYGLPTVDADPEQEKEAEKDTTSTQFGLPSVDEDEEMLDPDDETPTPVPEAVSDETLTPVPDEQVNPGEETPTPVPHPPSEDEPQRTGNWTGWEEDVGDEPSEESVLSAWGISSEEETSSPEPPEEQAKHATQEFDAEAAEEEESSVVEGKLKTQMGMPQVDRQDGEASSPALADISSPTRREAEAVESDRTEEFQIDSMDELERQVRDLRTESDVEEADEVERDESDSEAEPGSSGAGIVSKPDEANGGAADSGVVSGAPGLDSDSGGESSSGLGPGAYSNPEREEADEANDGGVLGGGTYRKHDVDPDESGGLPSPSEIGAGGSPDEEEGASDADSSLETRDASSSAGAQDGASVRDMVHRGSAEAEGGDENDQSESRESELAGPDESGLVTEREGPTGFEVDRSDDELSIRDGVQGDAGQRLGDNIPDDGGDPPAEPGDEGTEQASELQTANEEDAPQGPTDGQSEPDLDLEFVEEDDTAAPEEPDATGTSDGEPEVEGEKPRAADEDEETESRGEVITDDQEEVADEIRPDAGEEIADEADEEKSTEGVMGERDTRSAAPPDPEERASGEDESIPGVGGEDAEQADSGATTRPGENSEEDDLSRYAMLTQTVCGLIAGISFGMAVLVQMLTGDPGAEILLLSLLLASGIGALVSIVLPFVAFGGALRGALYLGFGVLVAALGVSSMIVGPVGLAVGPIVALFGSIFAVVAGAVPHVVTALEE